jgi:hypothetical protein
MILFGASLSSSAVAAKGSGGDGLLRRDEAGDAFNKSIAPSYRVARLFDREFRSRAGRIVGGL